jgi:hypothetical protein
MYKFPLKLNFLVLWLHCKVATNNYNLKMFFDCQLNCQSFPYDFPDCFAYSQFMARQAAELQEQCSTRPLPKRGLSSPPPPFWRFSVGPGSGISSQETEDLAVNMGHHLTEDLLANGGKTRNEPVAATGLQLQK